MNHDIARPYTATYVIVRKDDKIAFVLRTGTDWMNDHYGLPSGKVEHGESFLQGAVREVKEEIGIDIAQEDLKPVLTMHRNQPAGEMVWVDVYFEAKKWVGEPYNAEPHMHSELAWLDPYNLPENVIPPVREAIAAINAGQIYADYGW